MEYYWNEYVFFSGKQYMNEFRKVFFLKILNILDLTVRE